MSTMGLCHFHRVCSKKCEEHKKIKSCILNILHHEHFFFLPLISIEQKNLLVLGAAAVQPEQRGELLRHAGQLVASFHRGDISWHEQQRRREHRRDEHGLGGGSGNQQQLGGLPDGQCRTTPCHPDGTSLPSHRKFQSTRRNRFLCLNVLLTAFVLITGPKFMIRHAHTYFIFCSKQSKA